MLRRRQLKIESAESRGTILCRQPIQFWIAIHWLEIQPVACRRESSSRDGPHRRLTPMPGNIIRPGDVTINRRSMTVPKRCRLSTWASFARVMMVIFLTHSTITTCCATSSPNLMGWLFPEPAAVGNLQPRAAM
jgi:hypothetical protein